MFTRSMSMGLLRPSLWTSAINKNLLFALFSHTQKPISFQSYRQKLLYTNAKNICDQLRTSCIEGRLTQALDILNNILDNRGIQPDLFTYLSLLKSSRNMKSITHVKFIHAHIILTGIHIDKWLGNQLITTYAKCERVMDAHRVLNGLPSRNQVSFTAMISAYVKIGNGEEAVRVFCYMQRWGIPPDSFTFSIIISACAKMGTLEKGKEVHGSIIKSGFESDVVVGSGIVDMYVKVGNLEDARRVFDEMPVRNVVSWTSMIAGYAREGPLDEAVKLFERMPERNVVSWTAMVVGYVRKGNVDEALKLFEEMPERNVVSWNAMIAGCAQNGRVDMALELFWRMPERNVVSWNAMLSGYEQNGRFDEAVAFFKQMISTGVRPDPDSFSSLIPACAQLATLQQGREIHDYVIRSAFDVDDFVRSALVDMYAKCGSIEDARKIFNKMPTQNVVSWTAMISGYAMHGRSKEALHLFEQMKRSGTNPDSLTFLGVLSACCHAGLVDIGWKYFYSMRKDYKIVPTLEHYCSMVNLLGRAGHLEAAMDLVHAMPIKPNMNVWLSLLSACRVHNSVDLADQVSKNLIELDSMNSTHYVLLSNIYAAAGRWDNMEKLRNMMKEKGLRKVPGCSWIEVNDKVYPFFVGGQSHQQPDKIYADL